MPYSSPEGKDVITRWLLELAPRTVLDIGPGAGTYGRLLRSFHPVVRVDCVEIFEPYVSRFGLAHLYDAVIVGDVRTCSEMLPLEAYDVVIMGDVLEHMEHHEAIAVWRNMLSISQKACILSIPIVHYPQGPSEGNVHEAHVSEWDARLVLREMPEITEFYVGREIGVFMAPADRGWNPLPVGEWQ